MDFLPKRRADFFARSLLILLLLQLSIGMDKAFAEALYQIDESEIISFQKQQVTLHKIQWNKIPAFFESTHLIQFPIPEGALLSAVQSKVYQEKNFEIWTGRILNDPYGHVVIARNLSNQDQVAIEIWSGGKSYSVVDTFAGPAMLENLSLLLPDLDIPRLDSEAQLTTAVTTKSNDQFIDVLLAYTDAVVAFSPSAATLLVARMAEVNEMLEDSCARFRYRLVHIVQVTYAESGNFSTDLGCVYAWADGCLDNIHTLRDTYGADLFQLVLYQNNTCGLAHTNSLNSFNDVTAASVVGFLCGADTMAHEFAHNIGIYHDRYEGGFSADEENSTYGTGFGFVDLKNKQYTIMSYPNHCNSLGLSCTRIPQFSNPDLVVKGSHLGVRRRTDAVSQMNENFGYIANFRSSLSSYDPGIGSSCIANKSGEDIHCFIATAVTGSYMSHEVLVLRHFRDQVLLKSKLGRTFVEAYYQYGPYWAYKIKNSKYWKSIVRFFIFIMVFLIEHT
ncbi:MAG: hypothetical protein KDD34_09865, partial [Bdellovibrionales bacterium]|nr:hypothetical protein [Bdellovibrionales bacterium]